MKHYIQSILMYFIGDTFNKMLSLIEDQSKLISNLIDEINNLKQSNI